MTTSNLAIIESSGSLTAPNAKYVSALLNPDKLDTMRQESALPQGVANEHKILRDLVTLMFEHKNEIILTECTHFRYHYRGDTRQRDALSIRYWIRHHVASVFSDKSFLYTGTPGRYDTHLFHYERTMEFLRERLCLEHAEHVRSCEVFLS